MPASQAVDWHSLHHAYGSAADVPDLLRRIESFPHEADWQAEPWFSLWSALYHQGDIYPASIAAVPWIVDALSKAPGKATLSFFLLPALIAIADNARPVEVCVGIRNRFTDAIATLGCIAASALPSAVDRHIAKAAQVAVLVSQGAFQQADVLLEADA